MAKVTLTHQSSIRKRTNWPPPDRSCEQVLQRLKDSLNMFKASPWSHQSPQSIQFTTSCACGVKKGGCSIAQRQHTLKFGHLCLGQLRSLRLRLIGRRNNPVWTPEGHGRRMDEQYPRPRAGRPRRSTSAHGLEVLTLRRLTSE